MNKALFIISLSLIFILFYIILINMNFPYMSTSIVHLILSFILYVIFSLYTSFYLVKKDFYNLSFLFNATWFISISIALLTLSNVQYDLTYDYLLYLFYCIVFFNFGFFLSYKKKKNLKNMKENSNLNDDLELFSTKKFKFYFIFMVLICFAGYAYEILVIGFIPLFHAAEEGFFDNMAGFLSFIHYFATSLGGFAGVSLAFFFIVKKSKIFYFLMFLVTFFGAVSLLTKNILFIMIFFFLGIMYYYNKLNIKRTLIFVSIALFLLLLSSAIRTGSEAYIQQYSRINNSELPPFFHWFNTYFAINITHLNTYFNNEYTPTYGLKSISLITSLLLLKGNVEQFLGEQIIYFNGLGGNINVVPLLITYYTDFNIFSFIPMFFIGLLAGIVNIYYNAKKSFFIAVVYSGFMYILALSVFADYLNRLMIPIAVFFVLIPYYMAKLKVRI